MPEWGREYVSTERFIPNGMKKNDILEYARSDIRQFSIFQQCPASSIGIVIATKQFITHNS
jgi:hypothetical protein